MMQSIRNDQVDAAMWTIGSLGGVLADKSGIRFISIPRRDIAGLENLPTVSAFVQTPWYNAHKPQAVKIQAAISDAVAQLKSDPVGSSKAVKAKYGAATAQDQWDSRTSEHASGSGEFGGLRRSIRPIPKAISPLNMEFFAPEV